MVATLVRLRWRITLNALRSNVWAAIGLLLGTAGAVSLLAPLAAGAAALGRFTSPTTVTVVLGAAGSLIVIGWTLMPLLVSGMDATLDPRAMAAWTAPSWQLTVGLTAAGAAGVPGIVTGLALLAPALTWAAAGRVDAVVLALLLAPAALVTGVMLGRSVVVGVGAASSRRGRDLLAVLGSIVVMVLALLPSLLSNILDMERLEFDGLVGIARVMGLTPFGWALAAPGYLAQGQVMTAVLLAVGALMLPLVLLPIWHRVVVRVMTGTTHTRRHSRAYRVREVAGGDDGAAQPEVLPWQRRLARISSGPTAAVAARCLRYWRTDPRYLAQIVVLVMIIALLAGMIGANLTNVVNSDPNTTTVMLIGIGLGPGRAPGTLFMLGPVAALMCGWMIHDDLAFDSTALWTHLAAGLPGRSDRLGRALAAATWQLPLVIAVLLACGWGTGNWHEAPAYLGLSLGMYGVALAWSSLTSVLLPYETNPPGESPLKSRTSGTAFVAALLQMLGVLAIVAGCVPLIAPLIVIAIHDSWRWGWLLLAGGVLWGGAAAWGGTFLGGRLLDRRYVRLLATIRSWSGHDVA
ncbi:transporter [Actinomyces qiguomingii]|uniref:transporter n=1 Tax=Actinomyces qiguomingii TaxID=2057800 RepID=UPI000CA00AC4|nr:transporter [Actinomyces qiguomingii]